MEKSGKLCWEADIRRCRIKLMIISHTIITPSGQVIHFPGLHSVLEQLSKNFSHGMELKTRISYMQEQKSESDKIFQM